MVRPNDGGMSVFWGPPRKVPKSIRPRELGGDGDRPLFQSDESQIPPSLLVDRDGERKPRPTTHATVQPSACYHSTEYQSAIHSTRPHWRLYEGGDDEP